MNKYLKEAEDYADTTDKRLEEIWAKGTEISDVTGLIQEAYIAGCGSMEGEVEKRAIEFANWCAKNYSPYYNSLNGFTYSWTNRTGGHVHLSTDQLYNLFKQKQ